jgi:hypothetical protein
MNVLERAECLLDAGSSGNMNFTVVVRYRGTVEEPALEEALATLQGEHLLLRSTLLWDGESCRFAPTAAPVPVRIWTRRRGLRLNATLHAAFLQALVAAGMLPPDTTACTVVNLRHRMQPALPWDLMRLLRVCVETPVVVDPSAALEPLAVHLHGVLQRQLREGAPQQALQSIGEALRDAPSPRTFWQRSWRQGGLITNLGRVPVEARHGDLQLERLFFVANIEPITLPECPLVVLGALGFHDRLSLTCLHIEQQLGDSGAEAVLADMTQRLQALACALPPNRNPLSLACWARLQLPRVPCPRRSDHRGPRWHGWAPGAGLQCSDA